jgi:hypothetical protein
MPPGRRVNHQRTRTLQRRDARPVHRADSLRQTSPPPAVAHVVPLGVRKIGYAIVITIPVFGFLALAHHSPRSKWCYGRWYRRSCYPRIHLHVQDLPSLNNGNGQNTVFSHMDVELNGKSFENVTWPLIRGLFVTAR